MKNEAIRPQASGATEPWRAAMRSFDRELQRRGAADRTCRAYGVDVGQLALWCSASGIEPDAVDHPSCAATPHSSPHVARVRAPSPASSRRFVRSTSRWSSSASCAANPADLLPAPQKPQRLPRTLKAEDVAALLNRIPATTPLELRDRALFELAYACGLRAEELVDLDLESIDFDADTVRVEGKGGKTRIVGAGEPALRSVTRYLDRGRPALAASDEEPALLLSKSGRRLSTSDVRRRLNVWARHASQPGAVHSHPLRAIQELLGHSSISTTQVYTRIESARLRAAYARSHPRA